MLRLMRIVLWLIAVVCVIALVTFAVSNREIVTLNLWPLPFNVAAPLFSCILGAFAIGLLFGTGFTALSRQRLKFQARSSERRAERAERASAEQKAAISDRSAALQIRN
jgi:lipopolysaccharide assembly protein A